MKTLHRTQKVRSKEIIYTVT